MNPVVVTPYRPDGGRREEIWSWCKAHWESYGVEVITADSGDDPFTPGCSRNLAVAMSAGDPIILADADTIATADVVAMARSWDVSRWAIAYQSNGYVALTEDATNGLLRTDPARYDAIFVPAEAIRAQIESHAGCLIVPQAAFARVGGYDPRFRGWGYEDDAFHESLSTLWGTPYRVPGFAVHLYHEHIEAERFEQPHIAANRLLSDRYTAARGDVARMDAIVDERWVLA